ncbi:MAG: hypothetical protein LM580_11290 [Thermofilum sp.]|nr:hypothetical protein [Thermofilum sp.]
MCEREGVNHMARLVSRRCYFPKEGVVRLEYREGAKYGEVVVAFSSSSLSLREEAKTWVMTLFLCEVVNRSPAWQRLLFRRDRLARVYLRHLLKFIRGERDEALGPKIGFDYFVARENILILPAEKWLARALYDKLSEFFYNRFVRRK